MISLQSTDRLLMGFFCASLLFAGVGVITAGTSLAGEIAVKGYDAVAYFKAGKALKGSESFSFQWQNRTWYFLSSENRELFAASPEKYAPQYGGYCAWAMTEARKAIPDPEVWTIVNGKLYLNCSKEAYGKWSSDIPGNINKADTNWLKVYGGN